METTAILLQNTALGLYRTQQSIYLPGRYCTQLNNHTHTDILLVYKCPWLITFGHLANVHLIHTTAARKVKSSHAKQSD